MRFPNKTDYRHGFTLIELVVVVLILGILAGVAAPALFQATTEAQASAELSNARNILDAVSYFKAHNGEFPKDAGPGVFPTDLDDYLRKSFFTQPSPTGGQYDWDGPLPHAGSERVKLVFPSGTVASSLPIYPLLEEADDGSATTGWIRASSRTISYWP